MFCTAKYSATTVLTVNMPYQCSIFTVSVSHLHLAAQGCDLPLKNGINVFCYRILIITPVYRGLYNLSHSPGPQMRMLYLYVTLCYITLCNMCIVLMLTHILSYILGTRGTKRRKYQRISRNTSEFIIYSFYIFICY